MYQEICRLEDRMSEENITYDFALIDDEGWMYESVENINLETCSYLIEKFSKRADEEHLEIRVTQHRRPIWKA